MSRIGKQPVLIPDKVKVTVTGGTVLVEGPKGKVERTFAPAVKVAVTDKKVTFFPGRRNTLCERDVWYSALDCSGNG